MNSSPKHPQITLRPLEGKFISEDWVLKINPYIKFKLGRRSKNCGVAEKPGRFPEWKGSVTLPRKNDEAFIKLKLKDFHSFGLHRKVGKAIMDLGAVIDQGESTEWYDITQKDRVIGQVLVQMEYTAAY